MKKSPVFYLLVMVALTLSLAAPQAAAMPLGQDDVEAGRQLFEDRGCGGCHPSGGGSGPSLIGLFGEEEELQGGETVVVDEEYIRQSILEPDEQIVQGYGPAMPSYEGRVSEEELSQLVAYIRSLGEEGSAQEATPTVETTPTRRATPEAETTPEDEGTPEAETTSEAAATPRAGAAPGVQVTRQAGATPVEEMAPTRRATPTVGATPAAPAGAAPGDDVIFGVDVGDEPAQLLNLRAGRLIGWPVVNADGDRIGEVSDLIVVVTGGEATAIDGAAPGAAATPGTGTPGAAVTPRAGTPRVGTTPGAEASPETGATPEDETTPAAGETATDDDTAIGRTPEAGVTAEEELTPEAMTTPETGAAPALGLQATPEVGTTPEEGALAEEDAGAAAGAPVAEARVAYAIVSYGGFLGLGENEVPVPLSAMNLELRDPEAVGFGVGEEGPDEEEDTAFGPTPEVDETETVEEDTAFGPTPEVDGTPGAGVTPQVEDRDTPEAAGTDTVEEETAFGPTPEVDDTETVEEETAFGPTPEVSEDRTQVEGFEGTTWLGLGRDAFILNLTTEDLDAVPAFDPEDLPERGDPSWDADIRAYWEDMGVTIPDVPEGEGAAYRVSNLASLRNSTVLASNGDDLGDLEDVVITLVVSPASSGLMQEDDDDQEDGATGRGGTPEATATEQREAPEATGTEDLSDDLGEGTVTPEGDSLGLGGTATAVPGEEPTTGLRIRAAGLRYAVVASGGFLGLGGTEVAVPLQLMLLDVDPERGAPYLDADPESLETAPTLGELGDLNAPGFEEEIRGHWESYGFQADDDRTGDDASGVGDDVTGEDDVSGDDGTPGADDDAIGDDSTPATDDGTTEDDDATRDASTPEAGEDLGDNDHGND